FPSFVLAAMQGFVLVAVPGTFAGRSMDMIWGNAFFDCDFMQVPGIGRIVAADNQYDLQRLFDQLENGILALLRGIAYGIARAEEMLVDLVGPIFFEHGALEQFADLLGLPFEHRSLIGNADPHQMPVGVKSRRRRLPEFAQELFTHSAMQNVLANPFSIRRALNDQIVPGTRRCSDRFLMLVLAMDDGREVGVLIFGNAIPDTGHPWTC